MAKYGELTTVGEMLKEEFIEPYNLTQNTLANAIFVPPYRIHQIIKGQRRITADTDLRLTTYLGLSQLIMRLLSLTLFSYCNILELTVSLH